MNSKNVLFVAVLFSIAPAFAAADRTPTKGQLNQYAVQYHDAARQQKAAFKASNEMVVVLMAKLEAARGERDVLSKQLKDMTRMNNELISTVENQQRDNAELSRANQTLAKENESLRSQVVEFERIMKEQGIAAKDFKAMIAQFATKMEAYKSLAEKSLAKFNPKKMTYTREDLAAMYQTVINMNASCKRP